MKTKSLRCSRKGFSSQHHLLCWSPSITFKTLTKDSHFFLRAEREIKRISVSQGRNFTNLIFPYEGCDSVFHPFHKNSGLNFRKFSESEGKVACNGIERSYVFTEFLVNWFSFRKLNPTVSSISLVPNLFTNIFCRKYLETTNSPKWSDFPLQIKCD